MEFKVVKINHEYKNVVVSHKALIESDLAEQREAIIASLEKGQVLEGLVKNITDFGAFLDLGGVDGLIHITDLSWGRIKHPEEIVELAGLYIGCKMVKRRPVPSGNKATIINGKSHASCCLCFMDGVIRRGVRFNHVPHNTLGNEQAFFAWREVSQQVGRDCQHVWLIDGDPQVDILL